MLARIICLARYRTADATDPTCASGETGDRSAGADAPSLEWSIPYNSSCIWQAAVEHGNAKKTRQPGG